MPDLPSFEDEDQDKIDFPRPEGMKAQAIEAPRVKQPGVNPVAAKALERAATRGMTPRVQKLQAVEQAFLQPEDAPNRQANITSAVFNLTGEPQEFKVARATRARMRDVARFEESRLKEFDASPAGALLGYDSKNDIETGPLANIADTVSALEKQASERVGVIAGALSSAAAGDPTEKALKAKGQLDDILRQAQAINPELRSPSELPSFAEGLRQQRVRMAEQAKRAEEAGRAADVEYGKLVAQAYGLPPEKAFTPPPPPPPVVEEMKQAEAEGVPVESKPKVALWRRVVQDAPLALLSGVVGLAEGAVGLANLPTFGWAGNALESLGYKPEETKQIIAGWQTEALQAEKRAVSEAKGFVPTLKAMAQNPATIADVVTETVPSMLGGAAVGRAVATKLAPAAVGRIATFLSSKTGQTITPGMVGAAIGEGAIGAGSTAEAVRQETGGVTLGQGAIALASGGLTGAITLGGGALAGSKLGKKLGLGDIDTMLVDGRLNETQAGLLKRVIGGAISEGVIEELPQSAQETIAQNIAVGRPWNEGVAEAAAAGMVAGGVMGAGGNILSRRAEPQGGQAVTAQATAPAGPGAVQMPESPEGQPDDPFTPEVDEELASELAGQAKVSTSGPGDTQKTPQGVAGGERAPAPAPVTPAPSASPNDGAPVAQSVEVAQAPVSAVPAPIAEKAGEEAQGRAGESPAGRAISASTPQAETQPITTTTDGLQIQEGQGRQEEGVLTPAAQPEAATPAPAPTGEFAAASDTALANQAKITRVQLAKKGLRPETQARLEAKQAEIEAEQARRAQIPSAVPGAQAVPAPVAPVADAAISRPPAAESDQPQAQPTTLTPAPAPGAGQVARQAINRAQAEWVASGNVDDPQGERGYIEAVATIPDQIAAEFEAHGSARGRNAQEMDVAGRLESVAKSGVKRGDFGTLKGESRGFSNTFTQAPFIVVRHKPTGREVIVWNRPANDAVMSALRSLVGADRQVILSSELPAWLNQQAARGPAVDVNQPASGAGQAAQPRPVNTSTPSPRPANVSKNEPKIDTLPAATVARGENTPANFVQRVAQSAGLTLNDDAGKAMVQVSNLFHRMSPDNFRNMEVYVLEDSQWRTNLGEANLDPAASAAYNPTTNTLYLRKSKMGDRELLVSSVIHEAGHFAERFALSDEVITRAWANLDDAQIEQAAQDYNPEDQRTAAQIRQDSRARSEWVAQQFARVVAGRAKDVPASVRARLQEFWNQIKAFATRLLGSKFAESPELTAEVLRVMEFQPDAQGDPKPTESRRKGRKPSFAYSKGDNFDLLDAIKEAGGVPRPPEGATGGEWDGWKETFGRGSARLLVGRKVGGMDTWLQDELAPVANRIYTPDEFYSAIQPAIDRRAKETARFEAEERRGKIEEAMLENKGRNFAQPSDELPGTTINLGATFKVKGLEMKVTKSEVDDAGFVTWTVRDVDGNMEPMEIARDATFYPDRGTFRAGKVETPAPAAPDFQLAQPTQEQEAAAAEAKRQREQREAIEERVAARLTGDAGDQTRDMFGGGDMALFDAAQPTTQPAKKPGKFKVSDDLRGAIDDLLGAPAMRQTETPEFKRWFGASKVVDAQGKPLVVYHGTTRDFTEFSKVSELNRLGGFYFGTQKDANFYSRAEENREGGRVIPVYLSIKNPANMQDMERVAKGISRYAIDRADQVKRALMAEGFDGAILYFPDSRETEYVAFEPTQIKSAIGNSGAFDPANPSILGAPADQPATFTRKFGAKITAANNVIGMIVRDNPDVNSRQALAEFINEVEPRLRPFSESLFSILSGAVDVVTDGPSDWNAIYSAIDNPASVDTVGQEPIPENEPSADTNLERDRGDAATQDGGRAPSVRPERTQDGANDGGMGNVVPDRAEQGGAGNSAGVSASEREGGDSILPERKPGAVGLGAVVDGGEQPTGGGAARGPRVVDVAGADTAVDSIAPERPATDNVARQREIPLAERIALQRVAEAIPVIDLNLANIAETLPVLLPEQHDDVLKAERRFYEGKGRGILFTNGTGTGKTYTGLGIIKRFVKKGARDVLIVVPSSKKAMDWREDGERLSLDIGILEGIEDAGGGVNVTTYANFRTNDALAARDFDLVVYDESHKLMENADGERTTGAIRHQYITNHPESVTEKAAERIVGKRPRGWEYPKEKFEDFKRDLAAWDAKARANKDRIDAEVARIKDRTRVVFLSATPFAYHKTLGYADGYLFTSPVPDTRGGYNVAKGFDRFLMENFGYRMRYNKLTQPEAEVNLDVMERAFADRLMKEGAMSGRMIDVPYDYSREFVLLDAGLGAEIDRGIGVLRGWIDRDQNNFKALPDQARDRFNYIYTMQLLEAVKVAQAIDRIRQHIASGRKVILFHDYNNANPQHPFKGWRAGAKSDAELKEIDTFEARYPDLVNLDVGILRNPLALLAETFGEQAVFFNGTVSAGKRQANVKAFNDDASPVKLLVAQSDAMAEGVSAHDMTGKHQRVVMNVGLPVKPTKAIQEEGRAYRVGVKSNAIYEYIVIHTSTEKYAFGSKINERVRTAENLALGSQARALQDSFKQGYLNPITAAPSDTQGRGGKEADRRANTMSDFERAKSFYFGRQKKTQRTKAAEGVDYFATPEPIGLKMVEWAQARPNEKMLEPSAGHGAIARFFPTSTKNTYVEPSLELAEELRIKVATGNTDITTFEDLNVVNKFDAIVMNPPFGQGGSTAMKHLAKAAQHLRDGGRIIALVPEGPAADAKFNKWFFDNPDTENLVKVAEYGLPNVVFERAGANVKTRIVVIDKVNNDEKRRTTIERGRIDVSGDTIGEVFDRIEQLSAPARTDVTPEAERPLSTRDAVLPVVGETKVAGKFETAEFPHTKTKKPIYVAKTGKLSDEEYRKAVTTARRYGGYYSSFKGMGAIPGLHFPTEQARADFIADMNQSATLGTPADRGDVEEVEMRKSQAPVTLRAAGIEADDQLYRADRQHQEVLMPESTRIISQRGETGALDASLDREDTSIPEDTKQAIRYQVFKRLTARQQDPSTSENEQLSISNDLKRIADRDSEYTRDNIARALSARQLYAGDRKVSSAVQHVDEVRKRQEQALGPDGNKTLDEMHKELGKAAAEAVRRMMRNVADVKRVKVSKPMWEAYREDAARRIVKMFEDAPAGSPPPLAAFTGRIIAEIRSRLPEQKKGTAEAPPTPMEVIKEGLDNREKYADVFETVRAAFVEQFGEGSTELETIDTELANMGVRPYSEKILAKAVRGAFDAMRLKVQDLARQHVSKTDATAADLADALVKQVKLKPAEAATLAGELDAAARKMIGDARREALDRIKKRFKDGTNRQKKAVDAIARITRLNNLGALTRGDLLDAVAQELKLPKVKAEDLARIAKLADKVEKATDSRTRAIAELELMQGMKIAKGITVADVGLSIWLSNLLSGYTTQMANAFGNGVLGSAQMAALMATNPSKAGMAFSGWVDGLSDGFLHARDIFKTGVSLREMGEAKTGEIGNVLEFVDYTRDFTRLPDAVAKAMNLHAKAMRYVSRAMRAADAVFFYPAREAYARVATAKLLEAQYSGKELAQKVRETLFIAPDQFVRFRDQATREGFTGMDLALRVHQLIDESRAAAAARNGKLEEAIQKAAQFGQESTLNQQPLGFAGSVYRVATKAVGEIPGMRLFLPFLRVPTNLFNTSLNFTPVGLARAKFGVTDETGKGRIQFDADERARLYFQSLAGSMALVAIGMAALGSADDEEEPYFTITAKGTGDFRKNQQLEQTGWREFSIKVGDRWISYRDTPFLLPLAAVGNIVDAKRYQKQKDELIGANFVLDALVKMPQTMFETSMLSGLGTIMDVANGQGSAAKIEGFLANSATSAVIPNLVKQVERQVSPQRRESDNPLGVVGASIPGVRTMGTPRTDVLGETIERRPTDRFGVTESNDPLREALRDKKVFIATPSRDRKVDGQPLSEDEYRLFYAHYGQTMGKLLRPRATAYQRMTAAAVQDDVDRFERLAGNAAVERIRRARRTGDMTLPLAQ